VAFQATAFILKYVKVFQWHQTGWEYTSSRIAGLYGFADRDCSCPMTCVAQGEEPERACIISHNCLAEADQSSWVTDT